jgi:hypothetical protein
MGFIVDSTALGKDFFEYFGFPCHFSCHQILNVSHLSCEAATVGHLCHEYQELCLFRPQEYNKIRRTCHTGPTDRWVGSEPHYKSCIYKLNVFNLADVSQEDVNEHNIRTNYCEVISELDCVAQHKVQ